MRRLVSIDSETHLIRPGLLTPPIVCGSMAWFEDSPDGLVARGRLLYPGEYLDELERLLLDPNVILCGANIAFDFGVAAVARPCLLQLVFKAYADGRVVDVLIAQALNDIAEGHLFKEKHGGPLITAKGTQTNRYSLDVVVRICFGRTDAKANDLWKLRYALLESLAHELWPEEARQYPVDDAVNQLLVAAYQLGVVISPRHGSSGVAYRNLTDLKDQCETDWALHLGALWGLRTDESRIEIVAARAEELHAEYIAKFQDTGFFRRPRPEYLPGGKKYGQEDPDAGKKDTCAVFRAVAEAYGATGTCPDCRGTGHTPELCRGYRPTGKGKYPGCAGTGCQACGGLGKLYGAAGKMCLACVGTGFEDLRPVPRTDGGKSGICRVVTERDALSESGDELLMELGNNKHAKARKTYIPWLRGGVRHPITLNPNVLVASGRTSYGGGGDDDDDGGDPIQTFPRNALVSAAAGGAWVPTLRECIVARPGRAFVSVDFAAGELCSLSSVCLAVARFSEMGDYINKTKKPGSLHSMFAARMVGEEPDAFQAKVDSGDKKAKGYRQAAKPCFHPDTEVLTREGWKKVGDVTTQDRVASCYPVEGQARVDIVWERPLQLTRRKFDKLLHLKNDGIDLRVTPEHRMLVYRNRYHGPRGKKTLTGVAWDVVEAKEFGRQRGWLNAGTWHGGDRVVDERLLRLAVAVQADGTYVPRWKTERPVPIRLGFSKKRKIERLKSLLLSHEYTLNSSANGAWERTTCFTLSDELTAQLKVLLDPDKTFPWWWVELRSELRLAVLHETQFWDGDRVHHGRVNGGQGEQLHKASHYYSTIKKNVEVLQTMAALSGLKTRLRPNAPRSNEQTCWTLTIRAKADSRGENVEVMELPYDGDVVCLSVPSSFVLVRDGGVPVVVGQCNFGLPGGMGVPKLVLTNRKEAAGETKGPDGHKYPGIRFCILAGGRPSCGTRKITRWGSDPKYSYDIPPTCADCCDVIQEHLKPLWFKTFPEVKVYHKWVRETLDQNDNVVPCFGPLFAQGVSHRYRDVSDAKSQFSAAANAGFQSLIADITKTALRKVTREAYLDPSSSLYQAKARVVVFLHDELFVECDDALVHEVGQRVSQLMMEAYYEWIPDVYGAAEPAAMRWWSKEAEAVWSPEGRLLIWEPKKK